MLNTPITSVHDYCLFLEGQFTLAIFAAIIQRHRHELAALFKIYCDIAAILRRHEKNRQCERALRPIDLFFFHNKARNLTLRMLCYIELPSISHMHVRVFSYLHPKKT